MPLRRKKRAKKDVDARRGLFALASEVYEDGDTQDELHAKMKERITEDGGTRPFMAFLMKLLEMLIPLLFKGLSEV